MGSKKLEQRFKRGTLPCLRCVDESWGREDRLLLFYYLNKIFAIEYDYFASLPSAYVMNHEGNTTEQIQISDMEAFEQSIVGDAKKASCAKIQGASFSFGTYNKHLCFLCPYSGLYKNRYEVEEKMILFYQLEFYMLYSLMKQSGLRMNKVVRSYYPVIQNGILKDAMPLSDIAELLIFDQRPLVKYRENREDFDISCCFQICEMMEKKFKAKIKRRPYYVKDDEAYKAAMIQCGQETYKEIAHLDCSEIAYQRTVKSLDRLVGLDRKIIERYFNVIVHDQGRYMPCDVKEYKKITDIQNEDPKLPTFVHVATDDGRETGESEKMEQIQKPTIEENNLEWKNEDDVSEPQNEQNVLFPVEDVKLLNVIANDIPVAEGFNECKEFSLEDIKKIASGQCQEEELNQQDVNVDDKVQSNKCENENGSSNIFERNNLDEVTWLSDLKEYSSYDELFDEICKSVKSIYIEPAVKDQVKGLLIVGGEKAFFYTGELYGNKLFLKFLKAELQIYTSHIFEVAGYLHKVKVYGVKLFDVEIARRLSKMDDGSAYSYNQGEISLDAMKQYKKTYETYTRDVIIAESIHLAEKFVLIACSDGHIPPFKKLERLYVEEDDGILKPKFTEKNIPEVKGTFYWLQISLMNSEKVVFGDMRIYKQICVALDKYLNFAKGLAYLLRVDNGGILLYVTGNEMEQTDGGTYLKACARREMKKIFGVRSKFDIQILHQSFCP